MNTSPTIARNGLSHCLAAACLAYVTMTAVATVNGADDTDKARLVQRAVDTAFRPATEALATSTASLRDTLGESCSGKDATSRFIDTAQRFSVVEYYRLGAMNQDNRSERLFFWPDRRGIGQRQLSQLMADPERAALDATALADKSVALQGLPALERILFDSGREPGADVAEADCAVARAIADNMANMAAEISADWTGDGGVASALTEPSERSLYRSDDESVAALLTLVETGLVATGDKKIQPLLAGLEDASAIVRTAPLWRSDQTLANLRGNLIGLQNLLVTAGLAEAAGSSEDLDFEFRTAGIMLDAAEKALAAGDAGTARDRLAALGAIVSGLNEQLLASVAPALGVETGFNSGDGD